MRAKKQGEFGASGATLSQIVGSGVITFLRHLFHGIVPPDNHAKELREALEKLEKCSESK